MDQPGGAAGVGILIACLCAGVAAEPPPAFKITTQRAADEIAVVVEKGQTRFDVHSPGGIGRAVIERTGDAWPPAVVLRLHLSGLESFRLAHGRTTLDAAVSSQGPPAARVWKDGDEESPLAADDPLWFNVRAFGSDGRPAREIPVKEGYFEVRVPQKFLASNPRSITATWIDFYRN